MDTAAIDGFNHMFEVPGSEHSPSALSSSENEPVQVSHYNDSSSTNINVYTKKHIQASEILDSESNIEINLSLQPKQPIESTCMIVPVSQPRGQNKFWCCPFCKERVTKFARHLERRHRMEDEVKNFMALPPKNKDRISIISRLRNNGTIIHNQDTTINCGQIIVTRRPQACMKRQAKEYLPCPGCKGYYKKDLLHKHVKNCGVSSVLVRGVQQLSRSLISEKLVNANELMISHIIPKMRCDEITEYIKSDRLILLFGSFLSEKYAKDAHLDAFIRQKLRQLGRLMIAAREVNLHKTDLASLLDPQEYDIVINAIKKVCGFDVKQRRFKVPVLALNLGTLLTQCAKFFISVCIRQKDIERQKIVESFIYLHKIEFSSRISRTAAALQREASWNNAEELSLPQAADIELMVSFLKSESVKAYEMLQRGFNQISWNTLAGTTLLRVLMFNRKRVGEFERLLIQNFDRRKGVSNNSDAFQTLGPVEQALSYKFERVEIRGKKGRRVPILLTHEQIKYIKTILAFRSQAGVPSDNPYVFGKLGNDNTHRYFSACKLFRDYASKSGALVPENLRGTKLRKQISTISQVMDLSENDVQLLADYLGHDLAIHKSHYRTPELTLQVSKVAKILIAAEDKHIEKYRGHSLNTLNIQVDNLNNAESLNECPVSPRFDQQSKPCQEDATIHDKAPNKYSNEITPVKQNVSVTKNMMIDMNQSAGSDSTCTNEDLKAKHAVPVADKNLNGKLQCSGKIIRRTWITPEKQAVRQLFSDNLRDRILPPLSECENAIRTDKRLSRRTPDQVKAWINNQVRRSIL